MTIEKVVTNFSNGAKFGLDSEDRIAGFKGVNLSEMEDDLSLLITPDVASGGLLAAHTTDAMTHSIRIESADGTNYYLMATTTVSNRTGGG